MVSGSDISGRLDAQSAAAVLAELDRILGSDVFRSAPQLSAFLAFIVERAVDGRSAELKGYTVAVEAFGRPPDFDPQTDPIVRVEAGRLRKALSQYYLGDGVEDPIRITMPVGGYVPVFEFGMPAATETPEAEPSAGVATAPTPDLAVSRRWLILVGLALLLGLASLALWYRMPDKAGMLPRPAEERAASAEPLAALPAPVHLPVLAVAILDLPQNAVSIEIARRFSGLLVDALARFDDALTVRAPSDAHAAGEGADYVLELSAARFGETTETAARLRAVKDGRIVWTASSTRPLATDPNDPEWPEIARRMAIRLAEPFGIIHADFRQFATSPALHCVFRALDFRRTQKAEDHLAARTCLEGVLERDPTFQPAWSQLAFLILDEYTSDLNPHAGAPLDRALGAALNAVRLSPSSARAQQAMMAVLFARGQTEEALTAGREAMARNPFDPDIMAGLGARLVQLNRPAEGLPLLQRAMALSSGRPPSYDFFAFLAARFTGANKLAETYAANLLADEGAFSWLGRALQCAALDDNVGLAAAISGLEAAAPLFHRDPRLFLERKGFAPEVAARIISDLGPTLSDLIKRP
jgi:tetratricopeptide (TPR) repeat protein